MKDIGKRILVIGSPGSGNLERLERSRNKYIIIFKKKNDANKFIDELAYMK